MISPEFLKAGRAIFTVANNDGKHYTYKITSKDVDYGKIYFVALLTGSNNQSDYTYMGLMTNNGLKLTKKSKYNEDGIPVRVFNFAWRIIHDAQDLPEGYTIDHEGQCGRCGRPLTTPESIQSGLGPVCRGKM